MFSCCAENMRNPTFGTDRAAMFICGDKSDACDVAKKLATDIGFDAVVVGKLIKARLLEPVAMLWITMAMLPDHGRAIAFGLLRRD
jgi:8-hydroxy-5-deazaflavin:NADPH oxidoreductase